MKTLRYGDLATDYEVSRTPGLARKVRIHVRPDGRVTVEAPSAVDEADVHAAVMKRARWVFRRLDAASLSHAQALPRVYVSGETHFYLGRRYPLRVIESRAERGGVKLTRGRLEVVARVADPAAIRRRLNVWYKVRAADYFSRRLAEIAGAIDWIEATPNVKLVPMAKQWGSCSPSGAIHLNPSLIRAPRHCIDYVVTHELCHLRERNHGPAFHALLERHSPHWRATKSELDGLAEMLLADRVYGGN